MSSSADFDFLIGSWAVRHRRLKERLCGCTDWESFEGTSTTRPILGGSGNLEDNLLKLPGGEYRAVALRAFDQASAKWSIWWLDGRKPATLDVPVVGTFKDGIGTFLADDTFHGAPIKVRFLWSRSDAGICRWEQAFLPDGSEAWETN